MSTAWVFPGQGSQSVGMGSAWAAKDPLVKQTLDEAEDAYGGGLLALMADGPLDELTRTENTQPAILTISVAYARVLQREGLSPDIVAGHSLGEYSALVVAGALDFADAVRLTRLRGRAMQEAVPEGLGTMTALIGARDPQKVTELCAACAQDQVLDPAGFNAPGQVVLAGHVDAIARAEERAREFGCGMGKRLQVSAPFHCSLLRPAGERLAQAMEEIPWGDLAMPYVANVDAQVHRDPSGIAQRLVDQVSKPVLWQPTVATLLEQGVDSVLEVGAAKTLSGLVKRSLPRGGPTVTIAGFEDEGWR